MVKCRAALWRLLVGAFGSMASATCTLPEVRVGSPAQSPSATVSGQGGAGEPGGAAGTNSDRLPETVESGDSCAVGNGGCDAMPMATCTSSGGFSVSCACPSGYSGDGRGEAGCVDTDECAFNNGGCDTSPRANCINLRGASPSCECPSGTMGDGTGDDGCSEAHSPAVPRVACGKFLCDGETVSDPATALTWQRKLPRTYDGCNGKRWPTSGEVGDGCTWAQATNYCQNLSLAAGAWRLPTKDELFSIVDKTRDSPSIDETAFPDTPSEEFWSSSLSTHSSSMAWIVEFGSSGSVELDKIFFRRVRCVQ